MEYKDLEKVNKVLVPTNIKGKDYIEVNQRIKAFRLLYPEGTINTTIIYFGDGVVTIKADISVNGKLLATGHAQEKENSTFINKTSYIENCETSAVGRALGMLGIGIDTSIASAEEITNAMANQPINQSNVLILQETQKKYNISDEQIKVYLNNLGYNSFEEIKNCDFAKVGNAISELGGK